MNSQARAGCREQCPQGQQGFCESKKVKGVSTEGEDRRNLPKGTKFSNTKHQNMSKSR